MTLDCFKETEIGPIPVEWEVVPLRDVTEKKQTRDPRKTPDEKFRYMDVSSVSNETYRVHGWKEYHGREAPSRARKVVRARDTLFATVRPYLRNIAQVPTHLDDEICSTGFCVIRARHGKADPDYLYFVALTESFVARIVAQQRGSSYPAVSDKVVLSELIPLPPLPEQRRIAHVLSTIQRAIAVQEGLIAAAREVKRSLMQRLFTYGPGPDPAPTKETEIGDIPEHWEVTQLGKVVEKPQYGYTASASEEPIGPNFLRITDIQDNRVQWGSVPYCEIDNRRLEKYRLKQGDILIARIGATTGKTYLITECPDSVFASYLIRVRAKPESVTSEYLHYFTNTEIYWTQINASKGGRLKQGVNIPVLTSLVVPLPPLSEQRAIARILNAMDCKIEAEQQRKATLEALFKSTLQQLMTGQIRV